MILQTVSIFPPVEDRPAAPFIQRAADGGWHFDCGNAAGWSLDFPKPCTCGKCVGPLVWPAGAGACQDCAALPCSRFEAASWNAFGGVCLRCFLRRPEPEHPRRRIYPR